MKLDLTDTYSAGRARSYAPSFSVHGETDILTDVLLCRPTHLSPVPCCSVTRESLRDGFDVCAESAAAQHRQLQAVLEKHGVRCRLLAARPDLPDLCFTRDSAVTTPWGLLILNPAMQHRSAEAAHLQQFAWFASIPVAGTIQHGTVEGGDICIVRPGLVVIGCSGERTDEAGADAVAETFRKRGWQAHIYRFDPHFLHLDTQFCMVDTNLALACRDVLSDDFLSLLDRAGIKTLDVSYKEARGLGCNVLALGGKRIISSAANVRVNDELVARGYLVDALDVSQFTACGGGIHCLTMPLARVG